MPEPSVGTLGATLLVSGVSVAGLFPGIDPGVLIAAIGGGLIFVLTDNDYSPLKKWLLLLPSVIAGIVASPFIAALLTELTPVAVTAKRPIGALISSAIAVKILMKFADNPGATFKTILNLFRPGGGGGNAK
jgi:hypothetical protein